MKSLRRTWKNAKTRFWNNVAKSPSCWLWTGSITGAKYGRIYVDGKIVYAHRYSYSLNIGPITNNLFVLHKCDNTICVNPEHLFLGTQSENVRDKVAKLRQPHGERHWNASLSNDVIRDMRELYGTGQYLQKELSEKFGVSKQHVSRIINSERRNLA